MNMYGCVGSSLSRGSRSAHNASNYPILQVAELLTRMSKKCKTLLCTPSLLDTVPAPSRGVWWNVPFRKIRLRWVGWFGAKMVKVHSHGTAIENSKVGDSKFNARVVLAIQELGGLVRPSKSSLESRLGQKIPLDHVVAPWIIKHAASVITRYVVRDCGNTSYKLIKGRRCHEPMA